MAIEKVVLEIPQQFVTLYGNLCGEEIIERYKPHLFLEQNIDEILALQVSGHTTNLLSTTEAHVRENIFFAQCFEGVQIVALTDYNRKLGWRKSVRAVQDHFGRQYLMGTRVFVG